MNSSRFLLLTDKVHSGKAVRTAWAAVCVVAVLWIATSMESAASTGGAPDLSFNGTGLVLTNIGTDSRTQAIAIQSDGKIVVAGDYGPTALTVGGALVRYNIDGTLDGSFGTTRRSPKNHKASCPICSQPLNVNAPDTVDYDGQLIHAGCVPAPPQGYNPNNSYT